MGDKEKVVLAKKSSVDIKTILKPITYY